KENSTIATCPESTKQLRFTSHRVALQTRWADALLIADASVENAPAYSQVRPEWKERTRTFPVLARQNRVCPSPYVILFNQRQNKRRWLSRPSREDRTTEYIVIRPSLCPINDLNNPILVW